MWIQKGKGNWKNVADDYNKKEVVIIDEPEGQVVIKIQEPKEEVLIDIPEGQVVLKTNKNRNPRKKNETVKAI